MGGNLKISVRKYEGHGNLNKNKNIPRVAGYRIHKPTNLVHPLIFPTVRVRDLRIKPWGKIRWVGLTVPVGKEWAGPMHHHKHPWQRLRQPPLCGLTPPPLWSNGFVITHGY